MIWWRRTRRANTFHLCLKNVPHLLNATVSAHTFNAEADKGEPQADVVSPYMHVRSVCVRLWIAVWGTMQHVKPMWEVWKQGICCSQNEQIGGGLQLGFSCFVKLQLIMFIVRLSAFFLLAYGAVNCQMLDIIATSRIRNRCFDFWFSKNRIKPAPTTWTLTFQVVLKGEGCGYGTPPVWLVVAAAQQRIGGGVSLQPVSLSLSPNEHNRHSRSLFTPDLDLFLFIACIHVWPQNTLHF